MSITVTDSTATGAAPEARTRLVWAWAALAVACAGLAGSLSLSWGLALKPCPLCYYQRAFVMGIVTVLAMGLLAGAARPGRLGLLALPLALAGLGVALFHVRLELTGKLECPEGLLGLGTAPRQSLAVFAVLTALLAVEALPGARGTGGWARLIGAVVLGGLLAAASCTSNPPMPAPPKEPYASAQPDICRPPYRSPGR
jgi:disulfide bond formation protein DsbB